MAPFANAFFNEAIQENISEYGVADVGVNEQGTVIANQAAGTDVFASAEQIILSMIPAGHCFPNEILYKIISHMGPVSLSIAAQVNSDWKSRAIPLLYQNVQISVGDDGFGGNARKILRTLMSTHFLSGKGFKAVKDGKSSMVDKTVLGLIKSITLGSVSDKIKAQVPVVVAPPTAVSDEEFCLSVNELALQNTKSGGSQTAVSVPEAPNAGAGAELSTTEMQLIKTAVQSLSWIEAQDGPWDTNTFITSSPIIGAKQAAWHTELASGDSSSARNLIVALCSNTIESIKIIENDNHEDGIDGAFSRDSGGIGLDLLNTGSTIRKIGDAIVSPVTFPIGNVLIYGAFANLKEVVIQETRSKGRQHNTDAYGKLVSSEGSSANLNYLAASSITKVVLNAVDFGAVASTGLTEPAVAVIQLIITDPLADVGATQISVARLLIKCVSLETLVLGGCGRTAAQLASTIGSLALNVKRLHVFSTAGKDSRAALPGHGTHIFRDLNKLEYLEILSINIEHVSLDWIAAPIISQDTHELVAIPTPGPTANVEIEDVVFVLPHKVKKLTVTIGADKPLTSATPFFNRITAIVKQFKAKNIDLEILLIFELGHHGSKAARMTAVGLDVRGVEATGYIDDGVWGSLAMLQEVVNRGCDWFDSKLKMAFIDCDQEVRRSDDFTTGNVDNEGFPISDDKLKVFEPKFMDFEPSWYNVQLPRLPTLPSLPSCSNPAKRDFVQFERQVERFPDDEWADMASENKRRRLR